MATILLRTTYTNPQPYGDRTGPFYGTSYDQTDWVFDIPTRTASQQSGGVVNDDYDTGQYQDFSYSGEFYSRCVGTTREGYVHDGLGGFTIDTEVNSAACAILHLDYVSATNETASGPNDGTASIQASSGTAPLTATISGPTAKPSQPATDGVPTTFTGLAAGTHTLRITDSTTAFVEGAVEVHAYVAPVEGCLDEYADNYNPNASSDTTPPSCTYTPRWRSAWRWMAVRVPAVAGQTAAYIEARLFVGFRPGHPLAADRPYAPAITLRATVGPDGYATFRLGPLIRPLLGAPDGSGGYRLDLNSPTAFDADLYVGYELRRTTGELLEHGYALNAAVPDAELIALENPAYYITPFPNGFPIWPGYVFPVATTATIAGGLHSYLEATPFEDYRLYLACPLNPVPVAWLAPGGGYGYWVFQGRPERGDTVEDGQQYTEPESGERRYSQRGEQRRTISATSGVFKGEALLTGLRTLWGSPQVWYQPVPGGPWVPVLLEPGSFPAGRIGLARQELAISFTEAAAQNVQGQ